MTRRANPLQFAGLLSGLLVLGSVHADPAHWLMKINQAAASLSFSGVFVYAHDGQIESMQVARRIQDDTLRERLYSLSGETREIVRDRNRVWCYTPEQKIGVHDYRRVFGSGFPRILPADLDRLRRNYRFTEGGVERIAGRLAQRIEVIPRDGYRYGYRLWADRETGLLLRSDLVSADARTLEQYLFVAIDVDGEITDRDLQAVTSKEQLVWYGSDLPQPSPSGAPSRWKFEQVPPGYRLSKHLRRMSPREGREVEHLIFTDGLSTVSVFIKRADAAQSGMEGLSRMGAVHIHRRTIRDHRVTVMGETPARTVERLAAGVAYGG